MKKYYKVFSEGSKINQIICAVLINLPVFAYGASIGWMSPMTLLLQSDKSPKGIPLTDTEVSWMAAVAFLTCIPGNFLMAYLGDKIGRKITLCLFLLQQLKLYLDDNWKYPLDRDLFERVLDSEQCERQLDYIRRNNSLLLAQFIDAGLRVPRGILLGNLKDYGHYPQCLGIHEVVRDMTIDGKYCMIRVPANQNVQTELLEDVNLNFNPKLLELPEETYQKLVERRNYMKTLRSIFGTVVGDTRLDLDNSLPNINFQLALCIPKVCTTQEALSGLLFNITALGFKYEDDFCRLPNDRPWATVDYIAVVLFSSLGLLILLSTGYDVCHNVIIKTDPKDTSVILTSFSAYTNCKRLLSFKQNPNAIQCLDGIRALATFWVVIGHVFFVLNFVTANPLAALEWSQSKEAIWITTATLSVDTFFLISGILLVYTNTGKFTANQLIKSLPLFYLNRLLRMFPVLAAVVLFEASLYNRLGDGPVWEMILNNVHKCRSYWWTTLLHVQNFVNPEDACIGVSWYLAIDTHLHILSPIVLFFVLGRRRNIALSALTTALFISLTASVAYIYAKEDLNENYFINFYVNILTRAPPFFVGLLYGYVMSLWRGKRVKIPMLGSIVVMVLSIGLIGATIYCKYLQENVDRFSDRIIQNTFDSFLRPAWSLALGWIIFACANGYGGPINWFLSLNVWKIPSRISYAMYLTHMSLIFSFYSSALQPVYFTVPKAVFDFMAFLAIAIMTSFFITALIDAPFAILFKLLLSYGSKRSLPPKANKDVSTAESNGVAIIENIHHPKEDKEHK